MTSLVQHSFQEGVSYLLESVPDAEKQSVEELTTSKRHYLPLRSLYRRDTTLLLRLSQDSGSWWFHKDISSTTRRVYKAGDNVQTQWLQQ